MEMIMKTLVVAGLSAFALTACASDPAPRAASNAWSEGYTQRALSANRYLVEYRMDGADYQRAYDLALWRAAQLTLQQGYSSFEVINRDFATDPGTRPSTSFNTQYASSYRRSCGLVSCTTTVAPSSWNRVQLDFDGRSPSRVVSLEVILARETTPNAPNSYLAAEVIRSLQKR
jgi:hypothetical protein